MVYGVYIIVKEYFTLPRKASNVNNKNAPKGAFLELLTAIITATNQQLEGQRYLTL